jgi:hypothetical protein
MPTKPRFKRCTARRFCFALDERIEDTANARRKGFVLMVLTNFATGKTRRVGVCYKRSAKDPGLMFNVCPFCAQPIDSGFKDKTK